MSATAHDAPNAVRHRLLPRVHFDQKVLSLNRELKSAEGGAKMLLRSAMQLLAAQYSRGDGIDALRASLAVALKILNAAEDRARQGGGRVWQPMDGPGMWLPAFELFCWAACLGGRDELMQVIDSMGSTDHLLDGMAALVIPGRSIGTPDESRRYWKRNRQHAYYSRLFLPKRFALIYDALQDADDVSAVRRLGTYLKGWYVGSGAAADKLDQSGSGAWCLEAAALVRLRRLEDTSLRDHPNYPVDLAHAGEVGWVENARRRTRPARLKLHRRAEGAPRDPVAGAAHFDRLVEEQRRELQRTHADRLDDARAKARDDPASLTFFEYATLRLADIPDSRPKNEACADDAARAAHGVFRQWLSHLDACYSRGESLEALRPVFDAAMRHMTAADAAIRRAHGDDAHQALFALVSFRAQPLREASQLLAFAFAYGERKHATTVLSTLVRGEALTDALCEALSARLDVRADNDVGVLRTAMVEEGLWLAFPHIYGPLWDCIHAPEVERPQRLLEWVAQWPERAAEFNHAKRAYYEGFWCWEAMVFARVFGIDDRAVREARFYPGDMAIRAAAVGEGRP